MKDITSEIGKRIERPIKIVQFGEGNFLRAFADYMIDVANEKGVFDGGIAIVKPIKYGTLERFEKQNNLYTVNLRGKTGGKTVNSFRIVTSVQKVVGCYEDFDSYIALARLDSLKFVISNTTEAGIVLDKNDSMDGLPNSFPGKLTQFLYERFKAFDGDPNRGLTMLPVELIEDNGGKLKNCVTELAKIWGLPETFMQWLDSACVFCSTLVDRIVTGYPRDEADSLCKKMGYSDELLDVAEPFGLWVIETKQDIGFPIDKAGMPVVFTDDQKPYRERKVRILNGAHTSTVLLGWLCGLSIVRECMEDSIIRAFMEKAVNEEIIPFVRLPEEEVKTFATDVFERFENPFLRHSVLDISLNSVSKWKARILPSFKDYYKKYKKCAPTLTFSLAALLSFYRGNSIENGAITATRRDGVKYMVRDDIHALEFFVKYAETDEYVKKVLENDSFFGEDLTRYNGMYDAVSKYFDAIEKLGAKTAVKLFLEGEL